MAEEENNDSPSGTRFTFSSEEGVTTVNHHKKPKLKLSELEGSLPSVQWGRDRKKPTVSNVWDEETAEELAKYIDWHKRHPHCVTPRKIEDNTTHVVGRRMLDQEIPGTFYTDNGIKPNPIPREFLPPLLGKDGELDDVSSVAIRTEYSSYVENGHPDEDPWFIMSVKDQLEQSHMDGSHTTVKSKLPKGRKSSSSDQFTVLTEIPYEGYTGGQPNFTMDQRIAIDQLALTDKSMLGKPRKKISPWQETHVYSKFTAKGTALAAFHKRDAEDRIKYALAVHNNPFIDDKSRLEDSSSGPGSARSSRASSRQSSRKGISRRPLSRQNTMNGNLNQSPNSSNRPSSKSSKKRKKKKEKEKVRVPDQYDMMLEKLGGPKQIQQIEKGILQLAKKVARKSRQQKALIDTSVDLVEACDKLRVLKVTTILITGQGKAEMHTPDEETLFLHCFQKAIKLDNISSSLKVEDMKNDDSDRKKLQKILDLLIKYGANINSMKSKDSLGAIHLAVIPDNVKMVDWLIKNQASLTLLTTSGEFLTPLMLAVKFGNVHSVTRILEANHDINYCNPDQRTALHIAALYGQTRMALFLLRVGAVKTLKDKDNKTAAELAQENHFLSTAQAIASFTMPSNRYKEQLDFMIHNFVATQNRPQSVLDLVTNNTTSSLFSNFFSGIDTSGLFSAKSWQRAFRKTKEQLIKKWKKIKINPFQSEDSDEEEEDIDLDQIEEIARQKFLEENPDLAEQLQQEEKEGGEGDSNDGYDDRSLDSLQDGDQVYPF